MTYAQLTYAHLATVLPSLAIGTYLLLNRKGTPRHKDLGKTYLLFNVHHRHHHAGDAGKRRPKNIQPLGFIHAFSFLTLYSVPTAYFAARRGDIKTHRGNMLGLYIGSLLIAGSLTLMPGRGWFN